MLEENMLEDKKCLNVGWRLTLLWDDSKYADRTTIKLQFESLCIQVLDWPSQIPD